jgi:hypothetical protein
MQLIIIAQCHACIRFTESEDPERNETGGINKIPIDRLIYSPRHREPRSSHHIWVRERGAQEEMFRRSADAIRLPRRNTCRFPARDANRLIKRLGDGIIREGGIGVGGSHLLAHPAHPRLPSAAGSRPCAVI